MTRQVGLICAMIVIAASPALAADPAPATAAPAQSQPEASAISIAVLDYDGKLPGNADLGKQLADILSVKLSMDDAFVVVERAKLGTILEEHHLTLSGLVNQETAAQVGKLVGAKLLVMGKVFPVDKKLVIVSKVVGVETGQLKGSIREADMTKPLSEAIMLVSDDVAGVIRKDGAKLLPKDVSQADPLKKLQERLAGKAMPKVAVVIPEEHRSQRIIDPAVETEIKKSLIACGVTVVDTGKNDLADWAKKMVKGEQQPWPATMDGADYVVIGEAFSEFAVRNIDLVTCAARAEINLIDRKTGKIVLADRCTTRAVDLAEAIAGKTALQAAGRKLGIAVLTKFADTLPAAEKK